MGSRCCEGRALLCSAAAVLVFQGKDTAAFMKRINSGYWPALKMNWKMWTPIQFINVKYVPVQVSVVLFLPLCRVQMRLETLPPLCGVLNSHMLSGSVTQKQLTCSCMCE